MPAQKHHFYNRNLKTRANELRKTMTKAEACLWKYVLKARRINGYPFRRQRPVLNYIADFMCMPLKLIIEVDGLTHSFEDADKKDLNRENELRNVGFTILRFSDAEVLQNIDGVDATIREWVDWKELSNPPPSPPPAGDSTTCTTRN